MKLLLGVLKEVKEELCKPEVAEVQQIMEILLAKEEAAKLTMQQQEQANALSPVDRKAYQLIIWTLQQDAKALPGC